jgi:hypothetical protein
LTSPGPRERVAPSVIEKVLGDATRFSVTGANEMFPTWMLDTWPLKLRVEVPGPSWAVKPSSTPSIEPCTARP